MLTLLSPAGLWALMALAGPLALHLWRRPPRTVRWGSLRFLEHRTHRRPRDLRWLERLLLALRLLLLAFLALMLTRPHWRPASLDRPQHWALIDPNASLAGDSSDRLKALQKAGYETRLLAANFPKSLQTSPVRTGDPSLAPDLWSLLREADVGLAAGSSLVVFTPGRLASLRGDRPALSRGKVEWVITADSQNAAASSPPLPARVAAGPLLNVCIVHDTSQMEDANYLAASVRAVAQVSGRDIRLTELPASDPKTAAIHGDFLFWLAPQLPPASLAGQVSNLVTDAADATVTAAGTDPSWIVPQPGTFGAETLIAPVRLWQRLPAPLGPDAAVFWTDSFGRPLLTRSLAGGLTQWRFASRFQPAWTDLPSTTALAAWLRALLLPAASAPVFADAVLDLRRADPAQLATRVESSGTSAVSLPLRRETPGLQGWCWLIATVLFCLERLLSHRRQGTSPVVTNSPSSRPEPELAR